MTEKETSSLDLKEVANYQSTLKVCHTSTQCCHEWNLFFKDTSRFDDEFLCFAVLANEK